MKLSKTVLDVVRGASGAALALAIGCSSSGGAIHREPAARLSPVSTPPAVAVVHDTTPPPPATPAVALPPPPATITPMPPTPAVVDAGTAVAAQERPHRHRHPTGSGALTQQQINQLNQIGQIGYVGNPGVNAACGRG